MEAATLTISELARGIEGALTSWFAGELWIEGEIDSLRRSNNGHVYFRLVERSDVDNRAVAAIDVTLFDSARRYVNSQLRNAGGVRMIDGMKVRIRGRVEYYPPQGRIQVRMSGIDPAYTLALLVTERDRVVAKLEAEGALRRNASRPIARLPLRIGLVTSAGSAAMADFVDELARSRLSWHVRVAHVAVQGRDADRMIAAAISLIDSEGVEVIALVRGGGSRLDLATFDSETVARAISTASAPVFTGIGHEVDNSVADLVAHTSLKTPTACATALVEHVRCSLDHLDELWRTVHRRFDETTRRVDHRLDREARALARVVSVRMELASVRVDSAAARVTRSARARLDDATGQIERMADQLQPRATAVLDRAERNLQLCEATAAGADPERLLRRGWSITRTSAGTVIRDIDAVAPGDRLVTSVRNGSIESEVTALERRLESEQSDGG